MWRGREMVVELTRDHDHCPSLRVLFKNIKPRVVRYDGNEKIKIRREKKTIWSVLEHLRANDY